MLKFFGVKLMQGKKIIVIGCPGSGKSTFSKKLQKKLDLPLIHLDMLYWNADRTTVSREEFFRRLHSVLESEEWIIDGNYISSLELRLGHCDTVFFLDYPLELCLEGIRSRRGKSRDDMPWVEIEEDKEFISFVENFGKEQRGKIEKLLDEYSYVNSIRFYSRDEAQDFLNKLKELKDNHNI